jgi:threonine synthase
LAPAASFEDVLLAGLAGDGGLYLPDAWPRFSEAAIAALARRPYHEVAAEVILSFAGGWIGRDELKAMAREAYEPFDHRAVAPLVQVAADLWILELFHGPTLAFKDLAMQLLARLMDRRLTELGQRATIIGATSGDTGGAAIEAFRGSAAVDIFILYPAGRVSDVQRRMMTTPAESNVHALAIQGTFDDCQALVKAMFNDRGFRDRLSLAGVNSINWARIAAQVAYYFAAAVALGAPSRPVSFAVPTGNFGDVLAGYVAKRIGLPVMDLIVGSNSNDILPRTMATGIYEKRGVTATTSPSMDIEVSSNFERYLFEVQGRDPALIRSQMALLSETGRFEVAGGAAALARDFKAAAASEGEVADMIRRLKAETGHLTEPHTACALVAAEKVERQASAPLIVLSTAHPAKFPDAIEAAVGHRPALPPRLSTLMSAEERSVELPDDLGAVEHHIARHARMTERPV